MSVATSVRHRHRAPRDTRRRGRWMPRLAMTVICVLWVVPALGAVINTFRPIDDANSSGWWTVFRHPGVLTRSTVAQVHRVLFGTDGLARAMLNSAAVSIPATLVAMLMATFTAYALTFLRFRGRRLLYTFVVAMLVVPNQVAVLPMYKIYFDLGVQGTLPAVWVAITAFAVPVNAFLLHGFLVRLRTDLVDSARLDGASEFQIVWRIVVPLAAPALLALTVFQFLAAWNELFLSLSFLGGGGSNSTVPISLTNSITSVQTLSTAGVISVIVPVTVFLALQGRVLRGLSYTMVNE